MSVVYRADEKVPHLTDELDGETTSQDLKDGVEEVAQQDADAAIKEKFTYEQEQKLLRRVDWRLLPLLILAYLLKNLDGNSISYAKVISSGKSTNILKELNITTDYYAWTSTIFTIPFILAEVPSNLLIKKQTPRLHVLRIVVLWSIAAGCHAAAQNGAGLLTTRFFLGLFEAGLYPGILYHVVCWYRPDELAVRMAILGLLGQFSGILAALLAYGIEFIDGRGGISAWRWMFVIEALMGAALALPVYFFLPDFPDTAKWLTPDERHFLVARLPPNAARATDKAFDRKGVSDALKDPLLYAFTFMQMFSNLGAYGLSFWLPSIIASFGFTTTQSSQLLNIPPAVLGIATCILFAWMIDRTFDIPRPWYGVVSKVVTIGAFIALATVTNKPALYALTIIATVGSSAFTAVLMPWRAQSLKGSTNAAFAFAFQNGLSQISGIIGPQVFRSKYAPRYTIPYVVCIVFLVLSFLALLVTWYLSAALEKETRRVAKVRRAEAKANRITQDEVVFRR
ncbi:hypothetical protein I350_04093 [Cryptococcus amylolentus CBS 6273]|uniref:Major facilitator superfamily (MFS) profile domain-containing protein n=1 Tax=Cryptococcus amylolentus CBS 6273 TaxID=1296118 RepID=A0A1E3K0T3_9TREE|nr:hypothetical protein I350_04093 [Cryptococcus amylolentus CBS 6273]